MWCESVFFLIINIDVFKFDYIFDKGCSIYYIYGQCRLIKIISLNKSSYERNEN